MFPSKFTITADYKHLLSMETEFSMSRMSLINMTVGCRVINLSRHLCVITDVSHQSNRMCFRWSKCCIF